MKKLLHSIIILLALLHVSCSSFVAIERKGEVRSDVAFKNYLSRENILVTSGNGITLLNGAYEKFDDLFLAIKEAKHHIHLDLPEA